MRITTQMLNETARKAGIPVNNSSLLNYVNNKNNNSLLSSLQNNTTQKANAAKKSSYEKLDDAAKSLEAAAKALASDKEDNLFAKAKESGDTSEVIKAVKALVEKYNEATKQLDKNPSNINMYYSQMLKSLASKNAKLEDLETMFGQKSEFVEKLQFLSSHISDNVTAELESMGMQYGQDANSFSSYINNKYNLWS